jgi:hypothetical protein
MSEFCFKPEVPIHVFLTEEASRASMRAGLGTGRPHILTNHNRGDASITGFTCEGHFIEIPWGSAALVVQPRSEDGS